MVYHYNTYPKHPYKCKVIYKHGWVLKSDRLGEGNGYDVYAWRKAIEVIKTDNVSLYDFKTYAEIKTKWFMSNASALSTPIEVRRQLEKCFEDAFKLGQEEIITKKL